MLIGGIRRLVWGDNIGTILGVTNVRFYFEAWHNDIQSNCFERTKYKNEFSVYTIPSYSYMVWLKMFMVYYILDAF